MLEVEPTAKLVETGACISFYHHHGDIVLRVRFRGGGRKCFTFKPGAGRLLGGLANLYLSPCVRTAASHSIHGHRLTSLMQACCCNQLPTAPTDAQLIQQAGA